MRELSASPGVSYWLYLCPGDHTNWCCWGLDGLDAPGWQDVSKPGQPEGGGVNPSLLQCKAKLGFRAPG